MIVCLSTGVHQDEAASVYLCVCWVCVTQCPTCSDSLNIKPSRGLIICIQIVLCNHFRPEESLLLHKHTHTMHVLRWLLSMLIKNRKWIQIQMQMDTENDKGKGWLVLYTGEFYTFDENCLTFKSMLCPVIQESIHSNPSLKHKSIRSLST